MSSEVRREIVTEETTLVAVSNKGESIMIRDSSSIITIKDVDDVMFFYFFLTSFVLGIQVYGVRDGTGGNIVSTGANDIQTASDPVEFWYQSGCKNIVVINKDTLFIHLKGTKSTLWKSTDGGLSWVNKGSADNTSGLGDDRFSRVAMVYDSVNNGLIMWENPGTPFTPNFMFEYNIETDIFHSELNLVADDTEDPPQTGGTFPGGDIAIDDSGNVLILSVTNSDPAFLRYIMRKDGVWASANPDEEGRYFRVPDSPVPGGEFSGPWEASFDYCPIDDRFHILVIKNSGGKKIAWWIYNMNTNSLSLQSTSVTPFQESNHRAPSLGVASGTHSGHSVRRRMSDGHIVAVADLQLNGTHYSEYDGTSWSVEENIPDSDSGETNPRTNLHVIGAGVDRVPKIQSSFIVGNNHGTGPQPVILHRVAPNIFETLVSPDVVKIDDYRPSATGFNLLPRPAVNRGLFPTTVIKDNVDRI